MPTLKPCMACGKLSDQARCPAHRRGTTTQRGYGAEHQAERLRWSFHVLLGTVDCRRCELTIEPGQPWDLGHPDDECPKPRAPEHRKCNRGAPGRLR